MSSKAVVMSGKGRSWIAHGVLDGLAAALFSAGTAAQVPDIKVEIWELELGTHVTELPPQYLDPHCGTNGGPQSLRLSGWTEFALCPAEPETGLHEIWFTEDDEGEYVGLAYRAQVFEPGPAAANVLAGHKVIYSLLVDDSGLVQGYRIFTDPREPEVFRERAHFAGEALLGFYGFQNFQCGDLPPAEGETEVNGLLIKRVCVAVVGDLHVTVERHLFRKRGQAPIDPATGQPTVNYFDSSTRLEAIRASLLPQ